MKHNRFAIREDDHGVWTVFDVFTGWPATLPEGLSARGLPRELADDLVDLMNELDRERRAKEDRRS